MGDEQAGAIETVLAQIAAAQGSNPGAFSSDALTQAILDRLKEEVAKVYAQEGGEAPDGGGGGAASASPRGSTVRVRSAPAVGPLAEGPWMHSLWKASHEVEQPKAKTTKLSEGEISALVSRLQESQKKQQQQLLARQAERQAEETAHSFKPQISERSRQLSAKNKSLPERVEALLLKKKKRLDDIKQEREQKELEEATFRPAVNRERPATAGGALGGEDGGRRAVGHLMQYEIDRRIRAEQRKLLIAEVEGRDLTFSPALNKNSIRIVERLKEAAMRAGGAEGVGGAGGGGGATFRAPHAAPTPLVHSAPEHPDAAEAEKRRREAKEANEEYRRLAARLPGHEQETFRPHIDERSKALAGRAIARQFGAEDVDVTARLAVRTKGRGVSGASGVASPRERLVASGGAGRDAPAENAPNFFNSVPFDPSGKHDFVLRHFLHG